MILNVDEKVFERFIEDEALKIEVLLKAVDLLKPVWTQDLIDYATNSYLDIHVNPVPPVVGVRNDLYYIFDKLYNAKKIIRQDSKWILPLPEDSFPTLIKGYTT